MLHCFLSRNPSWWFILEHFLHKTRNHSADMQNQSHCMNWKVTSWVYYLPQGDRVPLYPDLGHMWKLTLVSTEDTHASPCACSLLAKFLHWVYPTTWWNAMEINTLWYITTFSNVKLCSNCHEIWTWKYAAIVEVQSLQQIWLCSSLVQLEISQKKDSDHQFLTQVKLR